MKTEHQAQREIYLTGCELLFFGLFLYVFSVLIESLFWLMEGARKVQDLIQSIFSVH